MKLNDITGEIVDAAMRIAAHALLQQRAHGVLQWSGGFAARRCGRVAAMVSVVPAASGQGAACAP